MLINHMGITIKAYIKKASSKAYKPTKRLEIFTSKSRGEWALPFPIKFSGDPCLKNEVYGGVECTSGRGALVLVERKWKEKKNQECVWPAKR